MRVVTMRTADLPFDELNKLIYQYDYSDKLIIQMKKRIVDSFANCKLRIRSVFFSSSKAIAYSKRLYDGLWKDCKRTMLRIGKHYWSECDDEWLYLFLTDYDPVWKVVYENEQDRKRARFVEGVLASDKVPEKGEVIDRSMRDWARMISNMGIEVVDRAMIDRFKAEGVKRVMWITTPDERVCEECLAMDRQIYPIDKVPDKPHPNCRCRLLPVK